jgi:hypothetical protein
MSLESGLLVASLNYSFNHCIYLHQQCSGLLSAESHTLCERLQRLVISNLPFRPRKVSRGGQAKVQTATAYLSLREWELLTIGLAIASTRHCFRASVCESDPILGPIFSVLFAQRKTKHGVTARPLKFALRFSKGRVTARPLKFALRFSKGRSLLTLHILAHTCTYWKREGRSPAARRLVSTQVCVRV